MRCVSLDILRAVAVLLIMGAHIPNSLFLEKTPLSPMLSFWMRCGWTGVDLFFVLSGFLVSGLLFEEYKKYHKIDLLRFFIRRGLKIYPAFYVFLAVSTILFWAQGRPLPHVRQYLDELFYIQNYYPRIFEHTWSLAVEEHFYLLIGFLVLLFSRIRGDNPFRFFVTIAKALGVAILCFRVIHAYHVPYTHLTHLYPTHLRMDSLFFGVLLSYFHHFRHEQVQDLVKNNTKVLLVVSLLLLAPALRWSLFDPFMHSFGFTFLYLGYGGLLLLAVYCVDDKKIMDMKIFRFMARIGVYSYSIYLWHILLARVFKYFVWPAHAHYFLFSCINLFIYIVGSVGLGIIMSLAIEMPLLHLRDKLFPSRSGLILERKRA